MVIVKEKLSILVKRSNYLDVGALHDPLLAVHPLDEAVGKPSRGVGHGQRGAAGPVLGLHHLSPGVLDPLGQSLESIWYYDQLCLR